MDIPVHRGYIVFKIRSLDRVPIGVLFSEKST